MAEVLRSNTTLENLGIGYYLFSYGLAISGVTIQSDVMQVTTNNLADALKVNRSLKILATNILTP